MEIRDLFSFFQLRRRNRLKNDITVYRCELEAMGPPGKLSNVAGEAINKALALLVLADDAVKKDEIDKGRKCFHGAKCSPGRTSDYNLAFRAYLDQKARAEKRFPITAPITFANLHSKQCFPGPFV